MHKFKAKLRLFAFVVIVSIGIPNLGFAQQVKPTSSPKSVQTTEKNKVKVTKTETTKTETHVTETEKEEATKAKSNTVSKKQPKTKPSNLISKKSRKGKKHHNLLSRRLNALRKENARLKRQLHRQVRSTTVIRSSGVISESQKDLWKSEFKVYADNITKQAIQEIEKAAKENSANLRSGIAAVASPSPSATTTGDNVKNEGSLMASLWGNIVYAASSMEGFILSYRYELIVLAILILLSYLLFSDRVKGLRRIRDWHSERRASHEIHLTPDEPQGQDAAATNSQFGSAAQAEMVGSNDIKDQDTTTQVEVRQRKSEIVKPAV